MTANTASYNSLDDNEFACQVTELKSQGTPQNDFYKSGIGLTFNDHQRSWIDPWEAHATDRFMGKNSSQNSLVNIATSIEPIKYKQTQKKNNFENKDNKDINDNKNKNIDMKKFGLWDGVITRCLLNIFGVIMFLRIGWIVGQSGILETILIILISAIITGLTTLSMSAMCTNGTVLDGGAYYIISRTLGPAFGGSVGILFAFGNMVAISMYLIGFAEALIDDLSKYNISITDNYIMDIRIWSNIMLIVVLILALIGLNIVIKAQIALFLFITFSIIMFFIGSFYKTEDNILYAIDGWTNGNFMDNLSSNYVEYEGINYDFWKTLAIFFPAVTGIMAGANISGDLKYPSRDIPSGTIISISISTVVYCAMSIIVGAVVSRSELIENTLVMSKICVWDYIIFIGIYAATLSSAIASLVGAPRILMAIANDNIIKIPGISYFAHTNSNGEPIRGYYLSFCIAFIFNCIGELNLIAPLISQFFIIVYLIINWACFVMEISHSPGWRPSFKYFNRYTGLLGAMLCLAIMFLLDMIYALVTVCIAIFLYAFISWKDPGVSFGGAFDSRSFFNAYLSVLNLGLNYSKNKSISSSVNWRPSFLLIHLSNKQQITTTKTKTKKNTNSKPFMFDGVTFFLETLRKGHSLIFATEISIGEYRENLLNRIDKLFHNQLHVQTNRNRISINSHDGYLPVRRHISSRTHFKGKRINGFLNRIISSSYRNGVQCALQTTGIGVLKPNTMIIAMKNDDIDNITNQEYVEILRDGLLSGCGIMILEGFNRINFHLSKYIINSSTNIPVIDIWWLVDDGGLILLLPYIMCLHNFFAECRVRINIVTDSNNQFYEKNKIKELIKKFRLPYKDEPRIIRVKNNNINNKTLLKFEEYAQTKINNVTRQKVISRWLRLSEILIEYSSNSSMILTTLPIPTSFIQPNEYIAILKIMSDQEQLPPTIIMRGNGQQTLTFNCE